MIIGLIASFVFGYLGKFVLKLPFHFSFIPFLLSIVVMVVVSLVTKPVSKEVVEETETGFNF